MTAQGTAPAVIVTRQEGPDGKLSRSLARRGYRVLNWPVIQTVPVADEAPLASALAGLHRYDWLVLTSPRAAAAVAAHAASIRALPQLALVGDESRRRLERAGLEVVVSATADSGRALAKSLATRVSAGDRVLFPAGNLAPDTIPLTLAAVGAEVDRIDCYETGFLALDIDQCRGAIAAGDIAAVTFASSSAVQGLREALPRELFDRLMAQSVAVAMGEASAQAVAETGYEAVEAPDSTLAAIADAVAAHCGARVAS